VEPQGRTAEDFLELVTRQKRGRLKVYVGSAAGVGKTYRMLEEAHALRKRGVDIVIAFVETHGRVETAALTHSIETIPRQQIAYRGVLIEEMDLSALLARKPEIAIVDELPHSNVPGSRNQKRYEDVTELLSAGINVITAFNIQHLESLNDLVKRVTGVTVRETVPDAFLKQADQVVMLDLAVEDLIERLRAGKIYAEEKIPWALEHFFKLENLTSLRELALREVAERVDKTIGQKHASRDEKQSNVGGRIMVCLASYSPRAKTLLYRASRLAGRLNTDWFVVFVERPNETPERIDATAQRYLLDNLEKARELGGEVVRLRGRDPAAMLLDFARSHGVGHIIIGRSGKPFWQQLLTRSVVVELMRQATDLDLHIVAFEETTSSSGGTP
jgi:two-component system sensor histidine kinase KdpD